MYEWRLSSCPNLSCVPVPCRLNRMVIHSINSREPLGAGNSPDNGLVRDLNGWIAPLCCANEAHSWTIQTVDLGFNYGDWRRLNSIMWLGRDGGLYR